MTSIHRRVVNAGWLAAMLLVGAGCSSEADDPASDGGSGGGSVGGSGGSPGGGSTGNTGGSTGTGVCLSDGMIAITDATNYQLHSDLAVVSQTVKDGTDITFDWSAVNEDFYGRAVDPLTDIDGVLVTLWGLTEEQLRDTINQDQLKPKNAKGALTAFPKEFPAGASPTSVKLLEMNSFKNEVPIEEIEARFDTTRADYQYPQATNTFMMSVSTGSDPTKNSRMVGFFKLDHASTNSTVALTNDSSDMTWEVHLANIQQLLVPASQASLTIDWSQMTTNAANGEYVVSQITEAVVAHYASLTLTDLEQQFLELRNIADGFWSAEVTSGTSIALGDAKDANGAAFPGIDASGVWLVALFPNPKNYNNPAPWSITVLRPCG
jgi:hypothetical protein